MQEQFAALGVEVERDEEDRTDDVEVWDANWRSFKVFLDCASRWRWLSTMSGARRLGLDLVQVDVLLRRRRMRGGVLADLLAMEEAALEAFNEVAS